MGETLISVDNFQMTFGKTVVIDNLSFQVRRGETFGLLGSNGCGKTTTIRALLGIYPPTRGTLTIDGQPYEPGRQLKLGYLPEERGLYKKEKVIDIMTYFGQLKGLTREAAKDWSTRYLARVDLADKAKTRLDKLSGGQQQKVQLGVTVMNDPDLLILDEPTKGFDPVNRRLLLSIIEEQRARGATVLMVTHQMDEVERLCDRVLLLKDGKAAAYGDIPEIQRLFGGERIRIRFSGPLPESPLYTITTADSHYAELNPNPGVTPTEILRHLAPTLNITAFKTAAMSLDEIFITVYGQGSQGEIS